MTVIEDKDLIYDVKDYDVVLVGLNIMNTMGNGFPHKVAVSFKDVAASNKETAYGDPKKLGSVRVVKSKNGPYFALCYISRGRYRPDRIPDTVDYEALEQCLQLVNRAFKGQKVATTIIGHSEFEGGGDRERILKLLEEKLTDVDLYVYDYEQIDYRLEDNLTYKTIRNDYLLKKIDKEEYYERKKKYIWERTLGIYTPIPEGSYSDIKKLLNDYRKKRDEQDN